MRYLIDLFDPSKWYVPRVSIKLHYRKNSNKETTTPIRSIARRRRLLRGLNSSSGIASGLYSPEMSAPLRQVSARVATPSATDDSPDSLKAVCPIQRLITNIETASPERRFTPVSSPTYTYNCDVDAGAVTRDAHIVISQDLLSRHADLNGQKAAISQQRIRANHKLVHMLLIRCRD